MISARKEDHVRLATSGNVGFQQKTNGLDEVELPYNALPELNYSDVDIRTWFATKQLAMPLVITGMTGGYPDAQRINAGLAECAAECGVAFGVGSMRAAIEQPATQPSYSVVQFVAEHIPIISNIGAVQLVRWQRSGELRERVEELISLVHASVFGIHLNPLQELMQPEGEPQFAGVLDAIAAVVECCNIPVLVKEVGAGIGAHAASRLIHAGVSIVDVGGAGGTSWAGIEILRHEQQESLQEFWDVGIPTAECIRQVHALRQSNVMQNSVSEQAQQRALTIIASGGIVNGTHIAKAIALGANLVGSARPLLQAYEHGGRERLQATLATWEVELKRWMFITGSRNLEMLSSCLSQPE